MNEVKVSVRALTIGVLVSLFIAVPGCFALWSEGDVQGIATTLFALFSAVIGLVGIIFLLESDHEITLWRRKPKVPKARVVKR